jgi:hypothetical protein
MNILSGILWLISSLVLVLLDRFFKTGYILTAIGISCLGGGAAAMFTDLGLGLQSAVFLLMTSLSLPLVAFRYQLRKSAGMEEDRSKHFETATKTIVRIAPRLDQFSFYFVWVVLVILVWFAVAAKSQATGALFGSIALACSFLVRFVAKRYTKKSMFLTLWQCVGGLSGGIIFVVSIALLRNIIHR